MGRPCRLRHGGGRRVRSGGRRGARCRGSRRPFRDAGRRYIGGWGGNAAEDVVGGDAIVHATVANVAAEISSTPPRGEVGPAFAVEF